MYNLMMLAFTALLFYVLTPGVLLSFPARGSLVKKAAVHAVVFAVVFALVYHLTHKTVWKYFYTNKDPVGYGS